MQLVCRPPNLRVSIEKDLYGSEKNHKTSGSLHSQKYISSKAKKSVLVTEEKLLPCSKVDIALFMLAGSTSYSSWTAILAFSR